MKNILAENLLRFNAKNLNLEQQENLKALTEQQRETVNLYLDYENKRPVARVAFVKPETVDQLPKSVREVNIEVVEPKNGGTYKLRWDFRAPKEMTLIPISGDIVRTKVYNKNLTAKLYNWYKSTINSPNATYAQTTPPSEPNQMA